MSALGLYGSVVVILAGSVFAGRAILVACGWRRWSWLEPPMGLAALLLLTGVAIGPARGTGAAIALALLISVSLLFLWSRSRAHGTALRPGGDRDSRDAVRTGIVVVVLTVLAASVPFAVAGEFGVLGKQVNHDLGGHLYNAQWLRSHEGIEPDQVSSGYPVGPYGLAVGVSELTGVGLAESFTAMLIATASVTALAALALLRDLPPGRRVIGAFLVGLPYLAVSYYVQSAFKETLMGMLALTFALALREVSGERSKRPGAGGPSAIEAGVPLGLLAAAAVQAYSFPGLSWIAGTAALWGLAALALQGPSARRAVLAHARPVLPAAGVAVGVLAVALLADLPRVIEFLTGAPETQQPDIWVNNIFVPVPSYEALGIWLSSDFRFDPVNLLHAGLLAGIGLIALAVGLAHLARRRELALLAGLASVAGVYVGSRLLLTIYLEAKALAIASPLVMLVALCGALDLASAEQRAPGRGPLRRRAASAGQRLLDLGASALRGDAAPLGRAALGLVFAGGALASTYLVLAGASVDRSDSGEQLAELSAELEGKRVLFLGNDAYAAPELDGASIRGPGLVPRGLHTATRPGRVPEVGRFDFDTVPRRDLDWADFVITTDAKYASEPPPNFHKLKAAGPMMLWERAGPTPARRTLAETEQPGAVLDCSTPQGRRLSRREGVARVFAPRPAYGPTSNWTDLAGAPAQFGPDVPAQMREDRPVQQTIRLAPGQWELSLQYASFEPLEFQTPGLGSELPPRLDALGPFWPLGTIEASRAKRLTITLELQGRSPVRHLLAAPTSTPAALLGAIAAAPVGEARETVPMREACGRLVDWYRLR